MRSGCGFTLKVSLSEKPSEIKMSLSEKHPKSISKAPAAMEHVFLDRGCGGMRERFAGRAHVPMPCTKTDSKGN